MSVESFLSSPWTCSHPAYENSSFNLRPAPEFATAEVVLASTYRAAGFLGVTEGQIPAQGRELDKRSRKVRKSVPGPRQIEQDTWRTILHGALQSPKQPQQSAKRFLQLSPVIPDTALYSGSARLSGNSWNPGQLVAAMVAIGCPSDEAAQSLWSELHDALSVGEDDDIWARWLQLEFERQRIMKVDWQPRSISALCRWPAQEREGLHFPARQFVLDLRAVLRAKRQMTRRQWASLLESVLRIGAVAHVMWLCEVSDRLWRELRAVLGGGHAPSAAALTRTLVAPASRSLVYGSPAIPIVRDRASGYLNARLGINLVLHELELQGLSTGSLDSLADVSAFLTSVQSRSAKLAERDVLGVLAKLQDEQARTLACKRGIGSNIAEFCRHSLGQRQTADDSLRGYDQGFHLKKRGGYAAAPWVVSLGPVALLTLVHCCLAEAAGPRSVQRLSEHLECYGLKVYPDNFATGEIGRSLRMLGLVLDSPDAESGMLLVPPFEISRDVGARRRDVENGGIE